MNVKRIFKEERKMANKNFQLKLERIVHNGN
jgi:hypothetical protein